MNPSKKTEEHHFSSFAMGATIGVIAALLFGTDEGRKIVKEVLDTIPEKYKNTLNSSLRGGNPTKQPPTISVIPTLETPHHATYDFEAPPPPPPAVHPSRPQ